MYGLQRFYAWCIVCAHVVLGFQAVAATGTMTVTVVNVGTTNECQNCGFGNHIPNLSVNGGIIYDIPSLAVGATAGPYTISGSDGNPCGVQWHLNGLSNPSYTENFPFVVGGSKTVYIYPNGPAPGTNFTICYEIKNVSLGKRCYAFWKGSLRLSTPVCVSPGETARDCLTTNDRTGITVNETFLDPEGGDGGWGKGDPAGAGSVGGAGGDISNTQTNSSAGNYGNPTNSFSDYDPSGSLYVGGTNNNISWGTNTGVASGALNTSTFQTGVGSLFDAISKAGNQAHDDALTIEKIEQLGFSNIVNRLITNSLGSNVVNVTVTNNVAVSNSVVVTNSLDSITSRLDTIHHDLAGLSNALTETNPMFAGEFSDLSDANGFWGNMDIKVGQDFEHMNDAIAEVEIPSSADAGSSSAFVMNFSIGGNAYTIDADPAHHEEVLSMITWVRSCIVWLVALIYVGGVSKMILDHMYNIGKTPQSSAPAVGPAGAGWLGMRIVYWILYSFILGVVPARIFAWIAEHHAASVPSENPFLTYNGSEVVRASLYLLNLMIPTLYIAQCATAYVLLHRFLMGSYWGFTRGIKKIFG